MVHYNGLLGPGSATCDPEGCVSLFVQHGARTAASLDDEPPTLGGAARRSDPSRTSCCTTWGKVWPTTWPPCLGREREQWRDAAQGIGLNAGVGDGQGLPARRPRRDARRAILWHGGEVKQASVRTSVRRTGAA